MKSARKIAMFPFLLICILAFHAANFLSGRSCRLRLDLPDGDFLTINDKEGKGRG